MSDEQVRAAGGNAENIHQAIEEDHDTDAKKFGTNFISRAVTMFGKVIFFVPAAIIGVLQVVLFILHLSFLGCCFSSDIHAVFLSVQTDVAAVFIPLVILFLGPWMGLLWITVVCGVIAAIAAAVASVVAIVALVVLLIFLAACLGSSSSRRNQYYLCMFPICIVYDYNHFTANPLLWPLGNGSSSSIVCHRLAVHSHHDWVV